MVRIHFRKGRPVDGGFENFLTGFWDGVSKNPPQAWGRPVGLAVMKDGSLLVADDVGKTLWKVTYSLMTRTSCIAERLVSVIDIGWCV